MSYTLKKILNFRSTIQSKSFVRACSKNTPTPGQTSRDNLESLHKVTDLERKFLVWTKKYKTTKEVPNFVAQTVMERARNRMRIKIANYMMAATVVGCGLMVYLGKQDQKEGKSVTKMNLEWHRQIKEEDEKRKATEAEESNQ